MGARRVYLLPVLDSNKSQYLCSSLLLRHVEDLLNYGGDRMTWLRYSWFRGYNIYVGGMRLRLGGNGCVSLGSLAKKDGVIHKV
jgi:hypothetical protein